MNLLAEHFFRFGYGVMAQGGLKGEALLNASVRENVWRIVMRPRTAEPAMVDPLKAGTLPVVGACCDLDDGKVDFFIES